MKNEILPVQFVVPLKANAGMAFIIFQEGVC